MFLFSYKITYSEEKKFNYDHHNKILIETKNRRRRLFDDIPIYEKVQMCIYMKMTDIKRAKLLGLV